jgi:hypothetical protein
MIYIPNNIAIANTTDKFSSIGNPGGDGGFLLPGDGGFGAANAIVTPKRYMITKKSLSAMVFIFIYGNKSIFYKGIISLHSSITHNSLK